MEEWRGHELPGYPVKGGSRLSRDIVDCMLDEIGRRRTPDESLKLTVLGVLREEKRISEIEIEALATTGYAAVQEGGWPLAGPAPWPRDCPSSVRQLIDEDVNHEQFDSRNLPAEDTALLVFLGLLTIVGERFRRADADN